MNEPNVKSVFGRAVEIKPWSGLGKLLALIASDVQAGKDLGSGQRSIGQNLWWQLPFLNGQTYKGHV